VGRRGKNLKIFTIKSLASGLGLGYSPVAPGTVGSLLGIPLFLLISSFPWPVYLLTIAAFSCLAMVISDHAERIFNEKDSPRIVIDEVAGMLFTCFLISPTLLHIVLGFFLFRFFDIVKPFPVKWLEKHLSGGVGIVADDIAAGIYADRKSTRLNSSHSTRSRMPSSA
jgi:phosphatidylglycerophosphatase A